MIAHCQCKVLKLNRVHYDNLLFHVKQKSKIMTIELLHAATYFKHWTIARLQTLNTKAIQEQNFATNDYIFKQGDIGEVVYMVKKGSVIVETRIEVDEYNRFPIGPSNWEIVKTSRVYRVNLRRLGVGSFFG